MSLLCPPDLAPPRAAAARLAVLQQALRDCRRSWRWQFGRAWHLRWENRVRRVDWRVEEENNAWGKANELVRHYAALRRQIAALRARAQ